MEAGRFGTEALCDSQLVGCTDRDEVRAEYVKQMLKLSDNPPMIPPGIQSVAEMEGPWWVAHTKARFEKAFAWDLLNRGIGYFLPLREKVAISGGKKRRVQMPLFTSYVFFSGTTEQRYAAMTTGRLCQTIEVKDQGRFLSQISAIQKALAGKLPMDPYPFAAVGRRCRVTAGPLEGMEGVVVQRDKLARLVLEVSILGQGASVEIDADLLEAMD
jgi:transcription antitermination factor NusG